MAGATWAFAVPPWQVPDEDAHFAYAQTVAELQRRPADDGRPDEIAGKSIRAATSRARLPASAARISGPRRSRPGPRPPRRGGARRRRVSGSAARRDGGGANAAANNPPGYYLLARVPYAAASRGDVIDRLHLMRVWSVLALAAFALSAWLLAGELVGRDRVLQLVAGAVAGLLPMATFVSSGVTPDALLLPLWGFATWLGVRGLRRGFSPAGAVVMVALAGAAIAIKAAALALLPGVAWALVVGLWRARRWALPARPDACRSRRSAPGDRRHHGCWPSRPAARACWGATCGSSTCPSFRGNSGSPACLSGRFATPGWRAWSVRSDGSRSGFPGGRTRLAAVGC